ncbi:hypothetical protein PFICI_13573 [Pestalotiopsis fici W106-1]|uniref:Uncharacterized protein n=1 Tax=Pestalotiopsis fici (strain W106-1 / CGMCC3.15140) TaxID=1229662 RepID=W3WMT9_PESFW|nr:uncharacterized protein PFICI_13573 [Pestalotiopsis fici W106-1]ETS75089.1 hypothetical protein PFICI_13573 [Pestalotiopsis fici W106-1]
MLHVQLTVVTAALALVVTILFFFLFHRGQIPQSSHSSQADRSTTRHSMRRELGLVQIYPKQGEETETDVDIIAIHGLDTRSPDTWT